MTAVIKRDAIWRLWFAIAASTATITLPDFGYANGTNSPIGNVLCSIFALTTGNSATWVATIAVAVVGLALLLSKISSTVAIIIWSGIGLVFGTSALLNDVGMINCHPSPSMADAMFPPPSTIPGIGP